MFNFATKQSIATGLHWHARPLPISPAPSQPATAFPPPRPSHLQRLELVAHALLGGLVQDAGVIQDVGGGGALSQQVKLARQCSRGKRRAQQQRRGGGLRRSGGGWGRGCVRVQPCRSGCIRLLPVPFSESTPQQQVGNTSTHRCIARRRAALTAAAWRPSACTGVCCCARHATTRVLWARVALLLATNAGCLRRALLAMLAAG